MDKLNRIIGGSAIAIAVAAMGAIMPAQAMEKSKCNAMLQTKIMKTEGTAKARMPKVMKSMGQNAGLCLVLKRHTSIIEGSVARLSAVGEKFFQLIGSPYEITGANAPAEELRTDGTALIPVRPGRD